MQFMPGRKKEKKCILKSKDTKNLLNKGKELIFKCRYRNRFKLYYIYVIIQCLNTHTHT